MTEEEIRKIVHPGCRNCKYQPEPMQTCEWLKHETVVHMICPRLEQKEKLNERRGNQKESD